MPVILMRHARSLLNEKPTIPEAHNVLSKDGIHQAVDAGISLQEAGIRRIITSPVARAHQTAMIVSSCLGGLPIETAADLVELKSKNPHEVEPWLPAEEMTAFENDITVCPAWGLESQFDVWNRVIGYAEDVVKPLIDAEETVLIVSHTFVMRALLAWFHDQDPRAMLKYRPKNALPVPLTKN